MGISSVGAVSGATGETIVYSSITSANTTGFVSPVVHKTRIVPKGVYNVNIVPLGQRGITTANIGYTASIATQSTAGTITAYDCENGRPMTVFRANNNQGDPVGSLLHVPKDAFLSISIYDSQSLSSGTIYYDVILTPTKTPFQLELSFTTNTATTTSGSSSSTSLNIGAWTLGWDYDSNEMAMIWTGQTGTSGISGGVQFNQFYLVRKGTNGVWNQKSFSMSQAAGMGGWYAYPSIVRQNPTGGFFIKNNILNLISPEGNLLDGSNRRWGWIKGSVAGASGSSVAFEPGHSNTGFADSTSSIATAAQGHQMYYYDSLNHKVCYFGYRTASNTALFVPKWYQYDILTDTVEYTSSGSAESGEVYTTGYGYVWDNFACDVTNGWFGGIVSTGGSSPGSYFGKWRRTSLSRTQLQVYSYPVNGNGSNTNTVALTTDGNSRLMDSNTFAVANGTILTSYLNLGGGSTVYATVDSNSSFSIGGVQPLSSNMNPITPKIQMILNSNKIGIARGTVERVYTNYPATTSASHIFVLSLYTASNTKANRGLLIGNTGGTINYALTGGMPGSNWVDSQATTPNGY